MSSNPDNYCSLKISRKLVESSNVPDAVKELIKYDK